MSRTPLCILLAILVFNSGCASFNPFKSEKAIDYNALTYGDDQNASENRRGSWANSSEHRRRDRDPAGVQTRSVQIEEDALLDASEEAVRNKIEARRGGGGRSFCEGIGQQERTSLIMLRATDHFGQMRMMGTIFSPKVRSMRLVTLSL